MVEVIFHSCAYQHESWFITGSREDVRNQVKTCLLREKGLNPLCAHSVLWEIDNKWVAMLSIIWEMTQLNPSRVTDMFAYQALITCLDNISYFVHTGDYCRITSWTVSWDILDNIFEWNSDSTIDTILDLCSSETREIIALLRKSKGWMIPLNSWENSRILFLIVKIQDKIEQWIRKLCWESGIKIVEAK